VERCGRARGDREAGSEQDSLRDRGHAGGETHLHYRRDAEGDTCGYQRQLSRGRVRRRTHSVGGGDATCAPGVLRMLDCESSQSNTRVVMTARPSNPLSPLALCVANDAPSAD
jgi:hypothetical protein